MGSRDRPQGMLTYADRAYLLGETTPETLAAERKKRQRIRQRIRNAIIDFSLLIHLPWDDLALVFSALVDGGDNGTTSEVIADRDLYEGLVDMIEVAMRGTTTQGVDFGRVMRLATLRSVGVYHLVYRGWLVDVEYDADARVIPERSIHLTDIDETFSMDELPPAAALALEEFGITSHEELVELAVVARETDPFGDR